MVILKHTHVKYVTKSDVPDKKCGVSGSQVVFWRSKVVFRRKKVVFRRNIFVDIFHIKIEYQLSIRIQALHICIHSPFQGYWMVAFHLGDILKKCPGNIDRGVSECCHLTPCPKNADHYKRALHTSREFNKKKD